MKRWKFFITFLAATLMANSQLLWAANQLEIRKDQNRYLRDQVVMSGATFDQYFQAHRGLLDQQGQGLMGEWLQNFGNTTIPDIQVQAIKEKNGSETVRFVVTFAGQSYTITTKENNNQELWINGQRFSTEEVRNVPTFFAKLAEKNSGLTPLTQSLKIAVATAPGTGPFLTAQQFGKLSDIKKAEYLSLLRLTMEAASQVDRVHNKLTTAEMPNSASRFVYLPLFASLLAMAESIPPKNGETCIVAGNISVYKSRSCNPHPDPVTYAQVTSSSVKSSMTLMMRSNESCTSSGGDTACNPLVYGYSESGSPFCLNSRDKKRFTEQATADCNKASPLAGDIGSSERNASYRRIVESFYKTKNGNVDGLSECFTEKNQVTQACKEKFDPQLDSFRKFKADADKVCQAMNRADQKNACLELSKRALDLETFVKGEEVPLSVSAAIVAPADLHQKSCETIGAKWDEKAKACTCPDGKPAEAANDTFGQFNAYVCVSKVATSTAGKMTPLKDKDDCKNEDGSKSHSFKCSPGLWLGIIGAGILAWLLFRGDGKTPTPVVPGEGGSGSGSGNNGGIRPTTTTLPFSGVH